MSKKIQILEATEHLLAQHGFEHLSMQLVAKEAEVATGTIYRYFTDKNDLLQQLRLHVMQRCAEKLLHQVPWDLTPKDQFVALWRNAWTFSLSRDDNAINREQFDSLPCQDDPIQRAIEREIFSSVHAFFQQGIEQRIFKPLATDVLASIGIEPAVSLAKKQAKGIIQLDEIAVEAAILACWDAISLK